MEDFTNLKSVEGRFLVWEMTTVALRGGTLAALFREMMTEPSPPRWLREVSPLSDEDMAKVRREGGRFLGTGARKVADWATVEMIARLRVPDEVREETLARWAGWWCVVEKKPRPPGYTGPIRSDADYVPRLQDPAQAPDVATCVQMYERRILEQTEAAEAIVQQLRTQLADAARWASEATVRAAEKEMALAETSHELERARRAGERVYEYEALLSAVTRRLEDVQRAGERAARELAAKDSRIAQLNGAVAGLTQSRERVERTHEARVRDLQEDYSRATVELRQVERAADELAQVVALTIAELVSAQTMTGASDTLVAEHAARHTPGLRRVLATTFASDTTVAARRFAAYVHTHLVMAPVGQDVYAQTEAAGIFQGTRELILAARTLPDTAQLEALVSVCPGIGVCGPRLLEEARAHELVASIQTTLHTAPERRRTVSELLAEYGDADIIVPPPRSDSSEEDRPTPGSAPSGRPPTRRTRKRRHDSAPTGDRWFAVGLVAALGVVLVSLGFSLVEAVERATGEPTLQYLRGTAPDASFDEAGATTQSWTDATPGGPPITTVYRVADDGFTPTGLTGTLRLHRAADCPAAVGVRIKPFARAEVVVSLLGDTTTIDLSTVALSGEFDQFALMFLRVDNADCPIRLVWEEPGLR